MIEFTTGGVLLTLAASYLAASLTLFYYPNILHKKRRYDHPLFNEVLSNKRRIMKVAHRGGSRVCMENTLEGFRDCVKNYKPDMLEMDVCFTKDKRLVVHHDSNLIRTCGIQDCIEHIEYEKLPNFQPKVALDFAYRQYNEKTSGLRIPMLEDVFKQFPTMPMNIEIKTPSHQAIEQFRKLLKQYKREHLTIWGIRGPLHETLKQPSSHTLTFFNDTSVGKLFLLYITGLLPFCKIRDDSLQLPLWTDEFHRWKLDTQPNAKQVNMFFNGLKVMNWMLPPLISHLRKRGILTIMWVCNTEEEFDRAVGMGCEGIMTDLPGLLDEFLDRKFEK